MRENGTTLFENSPFNGWNPALAILMNVVHIGLILCLSPLQRRACRLFCRTLRRFKLVHSLLGAAISERSSSPERRGGTECGNYGLGHSTASIEGAVRTWQPSRQKPSLKSDFSGLEVGFSTSGGEFVSEWAHGADVFKAVNQIGASLGLWMPPHSGILQLEWTQHAF